jgi:hypothetical protein
MPVDSTCREGVRGPLLGLVIEALMQSIRNWRGNDIEVASSGGGVLAVLNPWDNVVRAGVTPWPPPELIQKVYQSRHVGAYTGDNTAAVIRELGYYSDLQSLHSEDALTWSFFGPIAYAPPDTRARFVASLLRLVRVPQPPGEPATVWLWRRVPHPDTLVPGGPEMDFGIQTPTVFLLGEAKWKNKVAVRQGVARDKSQLTLRHEFCEKYGRRLLPGCRQFVVLGVSRHGGMVPEVEAEAEGVTLCTRDTTWGALAGLDEHPAAAELRDHLGWKARHSQD